MVTSSPSRLRLRLLILMHNAECAVGAARMMRGVGFDDVELSPTERASAASNRDHLPRSVTCESVCFRCQEMQEKVELTCSFSDR